MIEENFSRRDFMKIGAFGALALGTSAFMSGCSANQTQDNQGSTQGKGEEETMSETTTSNETKISNSDKVLVAYYSAQGHTKAVAENIASATGGELFEITPAEIYTDEDLNWNNSSSRVSREHDDETLRTVPLAQTAPSNWTDYDTVYVGYPIWWGIAAWPVNNFIKDNDFAGKTVIPFCTSASSGLGQSAELLKSLTSSGTWQEGMRFSSSASATDVQNWVSELNL